MIGARDLAIGLGAAVVVAVGAAVALRGRTSAPIDPPIVKDTPPRPKPPAPTASSAPPPSPPPPPHNKWVEDPESFAWPKPPPPRAHEVRVVDPTHIMVDRGFLDLAFKDQAKLARSARIIPEVVGGAVIGVKVLGLRPKSELDQLGLRNGDRLETLNDLPLGDPQSALDAYAHLRTATRVFVTLTRAGVPISIHYLITSSTVPATP